MVQSNKILTVSYGTFSCTLEGFDDAFGTMKAIAEYFRDLAAEDRYFGAEPPQPDADMLAHIAQQEIARRVEAHQEEGGIVLRAQETAAAAAVAAPVAVETAEAALEAPVAEEAVAEPETDIAEDVAAPEVEDVSDLIAAEIAEPEAEGEAEVEVETAEAEEGATEEDATETFAEDTAAAFFAGAQEDTATEDEAEDVIEATAETAPFAAPATDSIAAKLQRIRAVVSKGNADTAPQDFSEDEHADLIDTPSETVDAKAKIAEMLSIGDDASDIEEDAKEDALLDDLNQRLEVLDPADDAEDADVAETAEDETDEDTVAETAEDKVEDEAVAETVEDDAEEDVVAETAEDEAEDEDEAVVETAEDEAEDEAVAETAEDEVEDEAVAETAEDEVEDEAVAETAEDEVEDEAVAETAEDEVEDEAVAETAEDEADEVAEASIIEVSKEEFDAILASDRGEEVLSDDLTDIAGDDADEASSLSAEDEEDLMRELAAVEAEMGSDETVADADSEDTDEAEEDDVESIFAEAEDEADAEEDFAEERAILSDDVDSEDDVSRLLEEADDKLSDSETSDRRTEFAHLRAAMAAGKAEEAAGGSMSEAASEGAYREDLARVVKPRRPESAEPGERSLRPQDEKPAPLKLVAAQRIDAEIAPVQPRRVMSAQTEDMGEDGADGKMKFADYADNVGAHELPDLLEAAAAYLSFVEGQEQFSRPQLMTKVRMVENQEFSREDGLRSFGLLLRDGKIEKTQAGRFTVSDRIGFRPEDMRAAG